MRLWNKLNPADRELFLFNVVDLNWANYFYHQVRGLRLFLLNDPLTTLSQGRARYRKYVLGHEDNFHSCFFFIVLTATKYKQSLITKRTIYQKIFEIGVFFSFIFNKECIFQIKMPIWNIFEIFLAKVKMVDSEPRTRNLNKSTILTVDSQKIILKMIFLLFFRLKYAHYTLLTILWGIMAWMAYTVFLYIFSMFWRFIHRHLTRISLFVSRETYFTLEKSHIQYLMNYCCILHLWR